ncbi:MAG: di-trans,poly-cis-decaprenylcistransferase [Pseudomonadales bacterium]|nr:di-trans,poly-cis-decaprenylcistransferase [Pseudomonadales bacterium]
MRQKILTVFALASTNWKREISEIGHLLCLASQALLQFTPVCIRENIRVEIIGSKTRLPKTLINNINTVEQKTSPGKRLLRIAQDYSSRDSILATVESFQAHKDTLKFSDFMVNTQNVGLLIRTGKEQRLSDFMLWECAFAELHFPDIFWPDFDQQTLAKAINRYEQRDRRFGV